MSSNPFRGAFPHQHHDPRTLSERIQAQLGERIAEAVDMAALKLMVDVRERHGRPAPETTSAADRQEFEELSAGLLAHLHHAFLAEIPPADRAEVERATAAAPDARPNLLDGQVLLARRLPDYWQRFEAHEAEYARARLADPPRRDGWLSRLFRS
jgi:hypothetical protein